AVAVEHGEARRLAEEDRMLVAEDAHVEVRRPTHVADDEHRRRREDPALGGHCSSASRLPAVFTRSGDAKSASPALASDGRRGSLTVPPRAAYRPSSLAPMTQRARHLRSLQTAVAGRSLPGGRGEVRAAEEEADLLARGVG